MAEINNININGTVYGVGNIYAKMGISFDRFVELVSRDFYTPTLPANPTSSTISYTDADGSDKDFQTGQFARVADSSQEGGYKIWQCVSNNGTTASWVSNYDVMVDYVTSAISNKVDKVDGKGLSTEDFTTALKTKLEGLSNYDDTTLSNSITSLQNQFNALVNADADAAIDTFNEIVAFLAGLENTETLEGILADISSQISGKMDKVTLAAVATSGSYNDLSNKPTIPSALSALSDDASHRTVTDTEKAAWNAKSDFSGSYNDLSNKPTIPTVNNATLTIQKNGTSVGTFTANASSNKSINITVPTTTSELTNNSGFITSIPSEYVTETELTEKGYASTLSFTNLSASSWVSDSTYAAYPYRCDLTCSGVTANDYAEVVYGLNEAISGNYAPICSTSSNVVSIWSLLNETITIPTIKIIR